MLVHNSFLKIKRYNFLLLFILLSPGIHIFGSRYGIRLEQLIVLGFMFTIFPILLFKYPKLFTKELMILMSFLFYLPISLIINTNVVESIGPILGFTRFIGFGIIGYLIVSKGIHYEKFLQFVFYVGLIYLIISYLQHYNILNIGNFFFTYYNGSGHGQLHNYLKMPTTTFGIAEFTARFLVFSYIFAFLLYRKTKFFKSYKLLFLIGLFMFMFSESRGTFVAVLYISFILFFTENKKFTFYGSIILLLISIILIFLFYQYLISSDASIDKNILYRLEHTWLKPLVDASSSWVTIIYGMGLQEPYGDGSFTARFGQSGILGFLAFYFPILYVLVKIKNIKENDFYLNVFFFSTITLLVSNVTYQSFDTGKIADIYWLILGATLKYLYLKRNNSVI